MYRLDVTCHRYLMLHVNRVAVKLDVLNCLVPVLGRAHDLNPDRSSYLIRQQTAMHPDFDRKMTYPDADQKWVATIGDTEASGQEEEDGNGFENCLRGQDDGEETEREDTFECREPHKEWRDSK